MTGDLKFLLTEKLSHSCKCRYLIGGNDWRLPFRSCTGPDQLRTTCASCSRPTSDGFIFSEIERHLGLKCRGYAMELGDKKYEEQPLNLKLKLPGSKSRNLPQD